MICRLIDQPIHPSLAGYTADFWRSLLPTEALPFWDACIGHVDARPGSRDLWLLGELCGTSYMLAAVNTEIERLKPGRRPKLKTIRRRLERHQRFLAADLGLTWS
jgi:hypothetical protein